MTHADTDDESRCAGPLRSPEHDEFFTELTWRTLFRSNRNGRPGTMSAGMILVVVVMAMLAALFVNAGAIEHRSRSKNDGTWRHGVASFFETVASTMGLTAPRTELDEALGRERTRAEDAGIVTDSVTFAEDGTPAADDTGEVVLRAPTPEAPLRMHISGDSIVGIFGNQLNRAATETGLLNAKLRYEPSTGLSRPDFFNWPKVLNDTNRTTDPEVLVLMFGANDIQGMRVGDGAVQPLTPGWYAEYRIRVGELMDAMRDLRNDRLVVWVGALPMGPNSGVEGMAEVNYIYATEAAKRPWVVYFDSWPFFVDGDGEYRAELPDAAGADQLLRERDNIHLTAQGGDRLAFALLARLAELVDGLEGTLTPQPSQRAPDDVSERPEVPRPSDVPEA